MEKTATMMLKAMMEMAVMRRDVHEIANRKGTFVSCEIRVNKTNWIRRVGKIMRPLVEEMVGEEKVNWSELSDTLEWAEKNKERVKDVMNKMTPMNEEGMFREITAYYNVVMGAMCNVSQVAAIETRKKEMAEEVEDVVMAATSGEGLRRTLKTVFTDIEDMNMCKEMVVEMVEQVMTRAEDRVNIFRNRGIKGVFWKIEALGENLIALKLQAVDHVMARPDWRKKTLPPAADSEEDTECWRLADSESDSDDSEDDEQQPCDDDSEVETTVPPPTPQEEDSDDTDDCQHVRDLRDIIRDKFVLADEPVFALPPPSPPPRRMSSRRLSSEKRPAIFCTVAFCNKPSHREFHYFK